MRAKVKRATVTLKVAMTLDGRVATRNRHSKWITGPLAREAGHRLRAQHQAIAVGIGTVLDDDPSLTCRGGVRRRDPLRVVVDSRLRTPASAKVIRLCRDSRTTAPTWLATTRSASATRERLLQDCGAEVLRLPSRGNQVSLRALLGQLATRGVDSLLLEGGPTLAAAFLRARLVDRIVSFVAPIILGDPEALAAFSVGRLLSLDRATRLKGLRVRRLGDDLMLSGEPEWAA